MEQAVAVFASINFLIMGTSHCVRPKAWTEFFGFLHAQGRAGAFANGFLSLLMGSVIVAFHNVWSGVPIVLTLFGWVYLAKAVCVFHWPDWGVRSMSKVETASTAKFLVAGVMLIVLGLTVLSGVFFGCYAGSPKG